MCKGRDSAACSKALVSRSIALVTYLDDIWALEKQALLIVFKQSLGSERVEEKKCMTLGADYCF